MIAKAGKENSLAARLFVILFAAMFLSFIAATALAAYVSWTAYEGDAEERLWLPRASLSSTPAA